MCGLCKLFLMSEASLCNPPAVLSKLLLMSEVPLYRGMKGRGVARDKRETRRRDEAAVLVQVPPPTAQGRYKATWKGGHEATWKALAPVLALARLDRQGPALNDAGSPNHLDDKVDSDQWVFNNPLSGGAGGVAGAGGARARRGEAGPGNPLFD